MLRLLFIYLTTIIFLFLYFFKELGVLFLKHNFSKHDLLKVAFLSAFVTYAEWFGHGNFFFRGACLSKID